ncbi:MAG: tRNA 4-thiouridine(8) synthase ThiI [Deltaproteobacteria bacterium]|nr:tRNA 4-thiouridine(8) synthase ThiI [Deltaproteobacteria bacterium]
MTDRTSRDRKQNPETGEGSSLRDDHQPSNRGPDRQADQLILLRLGEVFLKGDNRPYFIRRLARNVQSALSPFPGVRLETPHGRMLVWHDGSNQEALVARLQQIFGLTSISPAVSVARDIQAMSVQATTMATQAMETNAPRSFRISAHRSDKSFPLTSPEIGKQVGSAVFDATGLPVDLTHPDLTIEIRITRRGVYLFDRRVRGAGGLPVGVSGRATLLLSGGIDSPVAGWLLLKRGMRLSAVTFISPPYTGPEALDKVTTLTNTLTEWGGPIRLHVIRFTDVQKALRQAGPGDLAVVLYRRTMMRVAEKVARREGANALATGESIGQVASQTVENLAAIEQATSLPVLRPLVTYDKTETIELARRIGTYETSILPYDDMCSLFIPKHPETKARVDICQQAEQTLEQDMGQDLQATVAKLVDEAEVISLPRK